MKLIVTNDDGIEAPGLAALEQAITGLAEITVVAPDRQQSNMGHQVTTAAPIGVTQIGLSRFRVSGTPADCARLGLSHLAPASDWVVSGINRGGNLGADVYLSGTVAAAREAALLGVKSIAVSHYVARGRELDWQFAVSMASEVLSRLLERPLPRGFFWNVNLPHLPAGSPIPEIADCPLDFSPLHVCYRQEGDMYIYAGDYQMRPRSEGGDVDLCFRGKITVTPIPLALACRLPDNNAG